MKKLLGLTLTAIIALSAGSMLFSACGSKASEEVTEDGWLAATAEENFYNVTAEGTFTSSEFNGTFTDQVAFTFEDGYLAEGKYYGYYSFTDGDTGTVYENMTSNQFFTRATKFSNDDGSEGDWETTIKNFNTTLTFNKSYASSNYAGRAANFGWMYFYTDDIADCYSEFTYDGNAYVSDLNGTAYTVKINDGHVSYLKMTDGSYTIEISAKNYGSTTVTFPSDVAALFE